MSAITPPKIMRTLVTTIDAIFNFTNKPMVGSLAKKLKHKTPIQPCEQSYRKYPPKRIDRTYMKLNRPLKPSIAKMVINGEIMEMKAMQNINMTKKPPNSKFDKVAKSHSSMRKVEPSLFLPLWMFLGVIFIV
jgi:hypothetical protein